MKTVKDPRHQRRIHLMQQLFQWDFNKKPQGNIKPIIQNFKDLDQKIATAAPIWPIEKINKIDLAILRLAIFELLLERKAPPKVIIDEAIELGKKFGGESSPSFINGVLGKLVEIENIKT